ncbi:hypothetical protein DXG03_007054 [Asterophora parasitica]|uniref:Uncharacterized protein n=1 Tax=Asterophora parasitica TaxID=117018 RepID=A0A9P7GEV5_9AGAR|nr:hypothetical protein DXG03_007054 [Asterophora parasitica]
MQPLGFHLADGAFHTYLRGDEYEDIAAAWDWNLIPGTTVDYNGTALTCDRTQQTGLERFVGGTSDGNVGLAVMRYTNPVTKTFRFQKVWFFLDNDVQHVMIANVSSTTSAPVYSILDQRRRSGSVATDETTIGTTRVQTLWHGDVGYVLPISNATTLSVQVGQKSGSRAAIGTSTEPPYTVDLFAAWLRHTSLATPIAYTAFPGTDKATFLTKSKQTRLQSVRNDARISAVFDESRNTAMIVFWDSAGGSTSFTPAGKTAIAITANGNSAIIYNVDSGQVVVSDPSQTLATVKVTITSATTSTLSITLPQGGLAGSSVTRTI